MNKGKRDELNTYLIDDGEVILTIEAVGFSVDAHGKLYLTNREGSIAVFAAGTWRNCLLKKEED